MYEDKFSCVQYFDEKEFKKWKSRSKNNDAENSDNVIIFNLQFIFLLQLICVIILGVVMCSWFGRKWSRKLLVKY